MDPMTPVDAYIVPDMPAASPDEEAKRREADQVKELLDEYKGACKFDEAATKQYAIDRRYAAGTADPTWTVDANLLGSYIDVLVSYLYAKNPKVSIRPAEVVRKQLEALGTPEAALLEAARRKEQQERADFAKTLELVVTRLWKDGRLKPRMKKTVRSALSIGPGWIKAVFLIDKETDPEIEHALNDARENLEKIVALRTELAEGADGDREALEAKQAALELQIEGLEANVEVVLRKALALDFVRSENVRVSLDVDDITDYLEAGWIAHDIYIRKSALRARFPRLTADDVKAAHVYHQKAPHDYQRLEGAASEAAKADDAVQYAKGADMTVADGDGKAVEFVKVIELWSRDDNHVKTLVDGIDRFAREPYTPNVSSSRFYPFFLLTFFPVDGARHPQSLSWRLRKLQTEYASSRSNFRAARERTIPGTLFNAGLVKPGTVDKIVKAASKEFIGVDLADPSMDIAKVFAEKPVGGIDQALFDDSKVIGDMEKLSGVQEALQSSQTMAKTATQADIEQSGFLSRTGSNRDEVEEFLTDLALYTAEGALQVFKHAEVVRMAGEECYWPDDMPREDILTLLDIEIEAGSTGRPNTTSERDAWTAVFPLLKETILQILEARAIGNEPLAIALIELMRETLTRLGDRIDVERFIPQAGATALNSAVEVDPMTGEPVVVPTGGGAPPAGPGSGGPRPPAPPPDPTSGVGPRARAVTEEAA